MKNFNLLSKMCSPLVGSQRKKIGVTLGEATIEHPFSTYSAPFGTCWQPSGKLHSVVRYAAMLVMFFTIGIGNVWGALPANPTWTATALGSIPDGSTVIIMSSSGHALPSTTTGSNPAKISCTVTTSAGVSTISPASGTLQALAWTLTKVNSNYKFYQEGSNAIRLFLNSTTSNTALRVGNGQSSNDQFVMGSGGKLLKVTTASRYVGPYSSGSDWRTYNSETAGNYSSASLTFYVLNTGGGCAKKVTISKGTPETGGSFDLDKTGSQDCCSALTVTVSNITAPSGKRFSAITQSGIASGVTIDQNAKTVTYAANSNGSSTINVTFESKGCTDHNGTNVVSGATTSHEYGPIDPYYEYSTRQILYTKTDLGLAAGKKGTIKGISFQYAYTSALTGTNSVKIYMANTSLTELSTSKYVTSFTEVYSGSYNCSGNGVYNEITFDTPFEYDGIGNLVVIIDDNSNMDEGSSPVFKYHTADPAPTYAQLYTRSASTNADPTAAATWTGAIAVNYRPNTKFCIQEADMTPATVTLKDNDATLTEASAGAGVTLPSRTGCSGYTFAGWTKSWVAAQDDWTTTAPVIIPAGSYTPSANENLYPVYTKEEGGGDPVSVSGGDMAYGVGTTGWTTSGTGTYSGNGVKFDGANDYIQSPDLSSNSFKEVTVKYKAGHNGGSGSVLAFASLDGSGNVIDSETATPTEAYNSQSTTYSLTLSGSTVIKYVRVTMTSKTNNLGMKYCEVFVSGSTTYYISVPACCSDPGLNYGTGSVTKTFGNGTFKNTLTNSHSVSVTYESSNTDVATVASDGTVTIQGAGNATITARFAGNSTYCADEASYTLTVNKADISPTLTYDPAAVTVGSTLTSFTLSGNSGSGSVSYSSSNDAIATVNSSGVVTGVAPGTVTITATIAATTNYNGNTATSNTITVNAAACTGVNSLHTGNKDQGGWVTNQCFEDADWGAADDAIYVGAFPLTNECYVGWAGGGSYYGTNWAVGGIKTYDIPTGRTLGWNSGNYYESYPGGALGTFHIYKNSTDENYYLRFKPSSYILRTGSNETSWTSREMTVSATNNHYYETAELDLTSTLISEHAYVDLKTSGGDGHVWCNFSNDRTASGNVKVKSSVGDADGNFRGTNLQASDNGTHGKFRIDVTKDVDNWKLAFVPMYRISYAAGEGSGGPMSPSSYAEISTTIAAAANGFTAPTGKQFNGWSDGVNSYAAGANVTMNSNVTLTAQWTDIDYTVTVSQSPDVSATTTGQTSTAHYNGTINLTTTVPSGYRFVNWTTSDGFSITNPTSATTASFTMPNKNVTVTANFQQTHTVDWYVGGSAPANKIDDDGQTTVVDHGGKISDFPAHDPDGSACDKTFVGWTNTSSYVHGTSPLFNDVAGSPTINADASFYAVFAEVNSVSASLTKMTADDDLEVGDKIVIIAQDTRYGMYQASASSYVSYWTTTDVDGEPSLSEIEADDKKYLDVAAGGVTDTWKLGDATNGYLYNSSSTNLEFSTTNSSNLTLIKWTDDSFTFQAGQYISCRTDLTGANANKWRGAGASCDPEEGTNCSGTEYYYLYKYVPGGTTATGHTITCADCGSSVTPTYAASPTGATVSVTKSAAAVASGSTVKTCTSVDLTVTITPASHYTLTGFTATGLSTGTATISPAVGSTLPKTVATTFTVTVSASATGTLNLTPTFTEDAHVAINWNVNGVNQSIAATEGLTWVYSGEDLTAIPDDPSVPAGCSGTKVFAGWSTKHSDATEEDASYYDDLFTAVGDAPTGISSAKTFYAVFATSSANPLAGTVMWDEPWTGTSDKTTPSSPSSGATVYNSTSLTYAYTNGNTTTQVYADGTMYSGGAAAPELLISKTSPSGVWTVTNIPTGGSAQTELTLSYKTNKTTIAVTSGTSGITIGDATVDGNTYTHTITISHSPSTINNFSLIFTNTGSANARIDDIHLVVPGSGTMTDYVTLCAPSYTITYNKNTSDPVTNLPSPTSVLQSTGSGTLSSTVPERATYTFSGWSETTSGAVAYAAGGSITGVTGDKTLYAVWVKTPVEELSLNYSELNKYVGDPAVTLEVTGVTPEGADPSVTWSSSNSSVASVVAATGVVTFGTIGTATITATSTVTGTTTAYCYVTVRNKPTASFTDLIHDGNGTDLSTYYMQNVAGTAIVFPTLDDYATPGDDCDSKHYVFVGWTTSDNNDDPQDHLVASGELEDDQDKVFYAVWADGVEGVSYTKLTTSTFKTSPTKYVIGAIDGDDTFYFYSCAATDANNGNGGCTNAPGTNAPIQFTLSGTAGALVATSTEASARYLTPLTAKNFQMSATSKTIQLNDTGTIANPSDDSWTLRFNTSEDYLRWYSSATGNAAYFYEITAGAAVSYRTSCCTNNVPAPTVIATNTAYTVTLTWAAVDGATGYEVSWNGGAFEAATSPCIKSGLTASTDYIYKVRATYDPLVKCGALVASGSVTTDDVNSVTYSGGTGTGSCSPSGSVAPASYEAGATVTLAPTNSFSLTSNTFAAWVVKDADDNDVPVSNDQFTMPAKNVTVTATWTPVQDKYYDRMHDGTDASHGGIADGEGKYYLVLEGCNYTVPTLTDDDEGDTECHTTHFKLLGWIAQSHLKIDGSGEIKPGEESYIFQGGGTKSATGATYYAVWAIMTE